MPGTCRGASFGQMEEVWPGIWFLFQYVSCHVENTVYTVYKIIYIYMYNVDVQLTPPNIKGVQIKFRPNIALGSLENFPDLQGGEQIEYRSGLSLSL